jgi:Uri superfamily endonuclease
VYHFGSILLTMPQPASLTSPFPSAPGDYVLWVALPEPAELGIGRLGTFRFPAGLYAYAGSARGPGGLAGRLRHHGAVAAKPHWHIDYLRAAGRLDQVWWMVGATSREHAWAAALADLPGAELVVPRFGASDCACPAHLVHFETLPLLADFTARTGDTPTIGSVRTEA